MHVRVLGTRGNIKVSAPGRLKHSGILVDDCLLLDIGEKEYLDYRPRWIFVTHLHPDHMALERGDISKHVSIYAPELSRAIPDAQILSARIIAGPYRITPVPTVHSHRVKSVGLIVEKGRKRLFYSSDMVRIESKYYGLLRKLDLVITEGSFARSKGMVRVDAATGKRFGHNGIPDLVEFFGRFTRRIIITHLGTWFFKDIAKSIRKIESFSNGVQVMPAYDGMILDV